MAVEQELNCEGLHGLGAGWVIGKENAEIGAITEAKDIYCTKCPLRKSCWIKHKQRVQLMFPKGAREIDRLTENMGQERAMRYYQAMHKIQDAYTLGMVMNLQDGQAIALTGKPVNRGDQTLRWPRESQV